jgi:two-component system C4-dicarboxylate transport sensor histidine kinase DctB
MSVSLSSWIRQIGIGGRLFFAFVLISSITLITSGLATHTYLDLSHRLTALNQQDIPGLEAAARLNDKSRLIVATAPLLVTADANTARKNAMQALRSAITEMDALMRNLPDYNRYFVELMAQIHNSLTLLNQSVEKRETVRAAITEQNHYIFPFFDNLIVKLNNLPQSAKWAPVIHRLYYLAGLMEKVSNDASFNELDYTFLRLETLGSEIQSRLPELPYLTPLLRQDITTLIALSSRQGDLFQLKNEELELGYQQSYFLENSQNHIQQLAAQINQYTNSTNTSIRDSLNNAMQLMKSSIRNVLLLSLVSLAVACAISWFYVRKNVLQRISELQKNMRAIASSQLETEVRIVGHDEISSMARDLKFFQDTAIEVERTNHQLAAEIEERIAAESQLKTTQSELVQAGKLAALGQLSVGITHEINQPLTAMASHIHSAGRHLEKGHYDKVHASLLKINHLLKKTAGITRHLKAFAREAGTECSAVDLDQVIREAIELMSAPMHDIGCECLYSQDIKSQTPLLVLAEPIRLEQVLVNLLSNAVDALSDTQIKRISIQIEEQAERVLIHVSDTGCGIESKSLKDIFDPFYTQKEVGEGLGLGLSISYNIIQDFGGKIRVQSTVGQGSCFTLELQKQS